MLKRRSVWGLGVAIATISAAGCTPDPPASGPGSRTTSPSSTPTAAVDLPTLSQLTFTPVQSPLSSLDDLGTSALLGSLVLVTGKRGGTRELSAFDAVKGTRLWGHADGINAWNDMLPAGQSVIGDFTFVGESRPTALSRVYVNPCPGGASVCRTEDTTLTEGASVLALDARTGAQRWLSPVIVPAPRAASSDRRDLSLRVIDGDDTVSVVNTGPSDAVHGGSLSRLRLLTAVGLDTSTGKKLWTAEQFGAEHVSGGRVLGYRPFTTNADGIGLVTLLDGATGREITLTGLPDDVNGTWGDHTTTHAVVNPRGSHHASFVVELATGRVVHTFAASVTAVSAGTDIGGTGFLMAWADPANRRVPAWTMALGEPGPSPLAALTVRSIQDGMVLTLEAEGQRPHDRRGTPLSKPLPGYLQAWQGDRLIVRSKNERISLLAVSR